MGNFGTSREMSSSLRKKISAKYRINVTWSLLYKYNLQLVRTARKSNIYRAYCINIICVGYVQCK